MRYMRYMIVVLAIKLQFSNFKTVEI